MTLHDSSSCLDRLPWFDTDHGPVPSDKQGYLSSKKRVDLYVYGPSLCFLSQISFIGIYPSEKHGRRPFRRGDRSLLSLPSSVTIPLGWYGVRVILCRSSTGFLWDKTGNPSWSSLVTLEGFVVYLVHLLLLWCFRDC